MNSKESLDDCLTRPSVEESVHPPRNQEAQGRVRSSEVGTAEDGRDQHDANVARHQRAEAVVIVLEALIGVAAARYHFAPFLLFAALSNVSDLASADFAAAAKASWYVVQSPAAPTSATRSMNRP